MMGKPKPEIWDDFFSRPSEVPPDFLQKDTEEAVDISLNKKENRVALTKMLMRLFALWQISITDQAAILHRSISTIRRYQSGGCIGDDQAMLDRVGLLMGIHKNLRILYPYNRDLVYRWITAKNSTFDGQAPLDIIKKEEEGLRVIRGYLESTVNS